MVIGYIISTIVLVLGILILTEIFQVVGLAIAYVLSASVLAIFLISINYLKRSYFGEKLNDG